ncbi:MAG: DNA polymerase domain-containing protein [Candidatus Nitrosocosmicus sp.]
MTAANTTTVGYLLDIYHLNDKAILWIQEKDGNVKRLEYIWSPSIYIASDTKSELTSLLTNNSQILSFIKEYEFENKFEYPSDQNKKEVLKLTVNDSSQIVNLAKNIENLCKRFGHYRLYNVDISPEQAFLFEKDIYPLGFYNAIEKLSEFNNRYFEINIANNDDNISSFDYSIPKFRTLAFNIVLEKKIIFNNLDNRILAINVKIRDNDEKEKEEFSISKDSELETILEFVYEINKIDPDIILTKGGDQLLFPHLLYRAKINNIEPQLIKNLNREPNQDFLQKKFKYFLKNTLSSSDTTTTTSTLSSSFISYGRVHFRPSPFYLYGRIHIDAETSFIYKETGLDGLSEISRICRIPMQIASRSTIGKCLSSLYFYNAEKKEILIPWKPITSEIFKTFTDLLNADKGGYIFESKPGVYEKVAEFDFVSLYPNIMLKKNISSETINCDCFYSYNQDSDNKVPGLEHLYRICKKRMGIVPLSLKIVLDRRAEYKKRKNSSICQINIKLKKCYDNRQAALKWILVTSFGYLGFNNSKFGRIDAHIAVCAFARDILLKTSKIAESHGFEIIHGIVDSIWVKRNIIENINEYYNNKNFEDLKKDIEDQTGFSISFEGIYKWIVFDSSKINPDLPALNRYFGIFDNGEIKVRGIETRQHDTPPLFIKFQGELLKTMSNFSDINGIKQRLSSLEKIYNKYKILVSSRKVSYSDLVFTKRISKNSDEYSNRKTIENCVIKILSNSGKSLYAGEEIKYIITDFYSKNHLKRAMPIELVEDLNPNYDITRYCKLLYDSYNSIIKYFK